MRGGTSYYMLSMKKYIHVFRFIPINLSIIVINITIIMYTLYLIKKKDK